MSYSIRYRPIHSVAQIELPYSKSEANRILIAQALSENTFQIEELSDAEDTQLLANALNSDTVEVHVGMAGTAFRFLTAYYSILEGKEKILTGADRMKERPIGILVDQLRNLGAEITYLEKEGFPPLKIKGKKLSGKKLTIDGSVSSQFVTALLLIAPKLQGGLQLELVGELVSLPYIDLTIALQRKLGVNARRNGELVSVEEGSYTFNQSLKLERDWSAAAFFYQLVAFSRRALHLKGLTEETLQGDVACVSIFKRLGVETVFNAEGANLIPISIKSQNELIFDLTDSPDLIPSIAVCASQLIHKTIIIGTQTLYIKESNRVKALQMELKKLGVETIELNKGSMELRKSATANPQLSIQFSSYNDHRMAMCLAPLVCLFEEISVDDLSVVNKSFPRFWSELEKLGINYVI